MAKTYLPVDREQLFLLPPNMREWLPESHLVWLLLDVVQRVDTSALHRRRRTGGVGRRGYDPEVLLALLIYGYCTKTTSSRQIERLCEVDVAYRIVCGGPGPDHTTIARFRQEYRSLAVGLFTDVLALCGQAGLARVGTVAIDGTKMAGDASIKRNRTREQVQRLFDEAERVDVREDGLFGEARGDELPEQLASRAGRRRRLDEVVAQLSTSEQQAAARSASQEGFKVRHADARAHGKLPRGAVPKDVDEVWLAEQRLEVILERNRKRRAEIEARAAAQGRTVGGKPPAEGKGAAAARARLQQARERAAAQGQSGPPQPPGEDPKTPPVKANLTDPQSRIMKSPAGWVQGYNAQAAVNETGVVLAATVTQDHNDAGLCVPMMTLLLARLAAAGIAESIGMLLFDAGYWSEANATADGPDRLIATTKSWKLRKAARELGETSGDPPPHATPLEAMEHRLRTPEGAKLYAKRGCTVEPVFGQHKHNRGYRRFCQRGLGAVDAEWQLMNTAHNILKLHQHRDGNHRQA